MKRIIPLVLALAALVVATGCDELEDLEINLGGWGVPYYGGGSYCCDGGYYYEDAYYDDEYYVDVGFDYWW